MKAIPQEWVKVVVPYKDQLRLYKDTFKERSNLKGFPPAAELPEIVTVDQMRGKQAVVFIYDMVVTCADKTHGIGIVADELRTNIVLTRASDLLIVVGSTALATTYPGFWTMLCEYKGLIDKPQPYIVKFAILMKQRGLSLQYSIQTPVRSTSFSVRPGWEKKWDSHLDWEATRNHMANQGDRDGADGAWQARNEMRGVLIAPAV